MVAWGCALALAQPGTAASSAPAADVSTVEDAGSVIDVALQSGTFSSETTVRTSAGIYQVHGGVSVSPGETASIKRTTSQVAGRATKVELCVESQIKRACYELL